MIRMHKGEDERGRTVFFLATVRESGVIGQRVTPRLSTEADVLDYLNRNADEIRKVAGPITWAPAINPGS